MKKNGTRLLSLLLVLTMVLSFAPTAFAAEPEVAAPAEEESYDSSWGDWEDWEETDPAAAPVEEEQPEEEPAVEPVEEIVAEEEPALVEEPVAVEEPVEIARPANTFFYVGGSGLRVTVDAPEGAFPADAQMSVTEVRPDAVQGVVANAGVSGDVLIAADISFYDANGVELQPEEDVEVSVTAAISGVDKLKVVHIDDENNVEEVNQLPVVDGSASATVSSVNARTLRFAAKSFSVYAVIGEGHTGENARLFVNFVKADGSTVSIPVKKSDIKTETIDGVEVNHFEQVLYDPGVGTLADGKMFKGWTDVENYAANTPAKTIVEIRNEVKDMLNAGVQEGDTVTYYAMVLNARYVSYLDELGASIRNDVLLFKDGDTYTYTVKEDYTPREQDSRFEGWAVAELNSEGKYVETATIYQNDDTITFTEDTENVVLIAHVPAGHWLIFNEAAKGASYTPPQFIRSEAKTQEPSDPTRNGYNFVGWFRGSVDDDGNVTYGDEFTAWNQPLGETTQLYAKWEAKSTAEYTVVIWKQQVEGDKYDFGESVRLTGSTSGTINPITVVNASNTDIRTHYARINGTNYQYTGFHLGEYDKNITVAPEGTTVVNVYYDRNVYTISFEANANQNYSYSSTNLYEASSPRTVVHTVEARYQGSLQNIWSFTGSNGEVFPHTDSWKTSWRPIGSSTYTARISRIETMPAEDLTLRAMRSNKTTRYFHYYIEALPGATNTRTFNGRQYSLYTDLTHDYQVVVYNDDFWLLDGFTRQAIATANGTDVTSYIQEAGRNGREWQNGWNSNLYFYYTRDKFPITYWDGKYVDGDGVEITSETKRGLLHTGDDIYYGASLADHEDDYNPTYDRYVFAGWYLDDACTQEFDFANSTMPKGGVKVYAKWVIVQYRVFLHPNVTEEEEASIPEDERFSMGGQATSFRIDYGEKISQITGIRKEYEQVGWYTDPGFTNPWNFDAYTGNDENITTEYKQTEDTNLSTPWATVVTPGNSDAANGRFWITKKLDLYLKWRLKLTGSDGIQVIYDAVDGKGQFSDGTTEFRDPVGYYTDSATAVGQGASTSTVDNYEFKYWVLQKWDGSAFVDTDTIVYPGGNFTVKKTDAHEEEIPDVEHVEGNIWLTYKIHLRAEYGPIEKPTPTHINWYTNVQDVAGFEIDVDTFTKPSDAKGPETGKGYYVERQPIEINQAYVIEPATLYSHDGYTFLGWAKKADATEDELFLKWDAEQSKFFAQDDKGAWVEATHVAADENQPYDDLYAVWSGVFYVVHSGDATPVASTVTVTMDKTNCPEGKYNLTKDIDKTKFLYGGYAIKSVSGSVTLPSTDIPYDGTTSTWTWNKMATVAGNAITPVPGETYYIKEVPAAKYLQAYTHFTYYLATGKIGSLFMISDIDDLNYGETGVVITDKMGSRVYKTLTIEASATGKKVTLKPNTVFYGKAAATNYLTCSADVKGSVEGKTMVMYWVTPDGATVTGTVSRQLSNVVTQGSITCVNDSVDSEITFKS